MVLLGIFSKKSNMTYQLPRTAMVQKFVPVTNATISIQASDSPLIVTMLNNTGLLAVLNLVLPVGAFDGQLTRITFQGAITVLSVTGAAGSVLGGITVTAANSFVGYVWDSDNTTWRRCA